MRYLLFWALLILQFGSPSGVRATTLSLLDLELRLDDTAFSNVRIYSADLSQFEDYGDVYSSENIWGLRFQSGLGYEIGALYGLEAELGMNGLPRQFERCSLGDRICTRTFGEIFTSSFRMGDGNGLTVFGDFGILGGTNVGDVVRLSKFHGGSYYQTLEDGRFAQWRTEQYFFTVVENNLVAVPLPAGFPLLVAALAVLGLMKRIMAGWRRPSTSPTG